MKKFLAFILLITLTVTACGCNKLVESAYPPLGENEKTEFSNFLGAFANAVNNLDGETLQRMYTNDVFFIETAQWLSNQPDLSAEQLQVFWSTSIITHMMDSKESYTIEQLKNMTLSFNRETMRGMKSSFIEVDVKIGFEGDSSKEKPAVMTIQMVRDPIGGAMRPAIFNVSFEEE